MSIEKTIDVVSLKKGDVLVVRADPDCFSEEEDFMMFREGIEAEVEKLSERVGWDIPVMIMSGIDLSILRKEDLDNE